MEMIADPSAIISIPLFDFLLEPSVLTFDGSSRETGDNVAFDSRGAVRSSTDAAAQ